MRAPPVLSNFARTHFDSVDLRTVLWVGEAHLSDEKMTDHIFEPAADPAAPNFTHDGFSPA